MSFRPGGLLRFLVLARAGGVAAAVAGELVILAIPTINTFFVLLELVWVAATTRVATAARAARLGL